MPADSPTPPSFSQGRKFNAGLHTFVSCLALLALVAMANYISSRHFKRFFLSTDTSVQLSSATHLVLNALTNEVRVVVFYSPEEPLYSEVSALLREYSLASPKLNIEHVDYRTEPARAGRVKEEYHLSEDSKNVIIFSANGKNKFVSQGELSEYDFSKLMKGEGNEVKRTAFHGERLFTSAILTVSDPAPAKVYFTTGHGEHDRSNTTTERGYGAFNSLLKDASITLADLPFSGTNDIPASCQLLVMAGPVAKLDPAEQEKLDRYLKQGGRLLLLIARNSDLDLDNLLARWGVDVGDNLVIDTPNTIKERLMVVASFGSHPVVKPLSQARLPIYLVSPRSVGKRAGGAQTPDAPQVTELATTGESGIAVTDYRKGIRPNLVRDRKGAISLMVAVEKGAVPGVNLDRGSTRMIVVGESDFLSNNLLEANREFAWHAANWLLDRSQLLGGIGPRAIKEPTYWIPQEPMRQFRWVLLGGIPGAVMAFGLMVWWRRRH